MHGQGNVYGDNEENTVDAELGYDRQDCHREAQYIVPNYADTDNQDGVATLSTENKKWNWTPKTKKQSVVIVQKRECCNQRLKRYLGIWFFLLLCLAIGVILMVVGVILPGVIIFLIGLFGILCSGWCFRKCSS